MLKKHGRKQEKGENSQYWKPRISVKCLKCGKEFLIRESRLKDGRGKFCSRRCSSLGRFVSKEVREKLRKANIGKKLSSEHKNKMSEAHKGKKMSQEAREKMSKSAKGRIVSEETRRKKSETAKKNGVGKWMLGRKLSEETKKKISRNSANWRGGISFEPYGLEFNENLREVIRNRDRRKCQICEKTELEEGIKLSVHHIDYNKNNNNPNNLISLCASCHAKTNHNREYWIKYFKK